MDDEREHGDERDRGGEERDRAAGEGREHVGEGERHAPMSDRALEGLRRSSEGLKRGSERARVRIAQTLGEPALFAITLSAVASAIFFSLGVVADRALALTPLVYLVAGVFFAVTFATYVEGSSLHVERGGASTFARYAFDEFWSFVAGWAILLDYLIVMAIGSVVISEYLSVFWGDLGDGALPLVIGGGALLFVAMQNIRGLSADRLGTVLRLSLFSILVLVAVSLIGFVQYWDPGSIRATIDLGVAPRWEDLIFATGVATVAVIGVEAASGLAGEIRVGRRGLRRVVLASVAVSMVLFLIVSVAALMATPVVGTHTALGDRFLEAPVLAIPSSYEPGLLLDLTRYVVGATAAALLLAAMNGQMLGLARLAYSLATNRQIPSAVGRLHARRGTPYVTITLAALMAFALSIPHDLDFLAGLFAFGAMIAFALAHLSVIVLRFRERERPSAFRVPLSVPIRGARVPLPAVFGLLFSICAWLSIVIFHQGARLIGAAWMVAGIALYVIYRRAEGKSLTRRFTIPAEALQESSGAEYGSILVPVFGEELDDDIVGTAGRLATSEGEEAEGGAVLEALYVFEIPMSLPIDARVPEERVQEAKRVLARAKLVGEEYAGVEVATAMVRGRSTGQAIVSEARRRGVEAIVLGAEEPSRLRGGAILGGRGRVRDRFIGETTRYVIEKAPCKVILTAPPAGEEGTREGVLP
ncbi:MAG: basic amino acid/polyamine antiporter, family [Thermoleophilaceae bacterium]|nr:basic amino acid/polyamine antiporter, family [Thermoleophilaceae bacterium]